MSLFGVTATELNFRSSPSTVSNANILAQLHHGQTVQQLAPPEGDWMNIRAVVNFKTIDGYVATRYLQAIDTSATAETANTTSSSISEGVANAASDAEVTTPEPAPTPIPQPSDDVLPIPHMTENREDIKRSRNGGRAYPIGESDRPTPKKDTAANKIASIYSIVEWLDVEHSARFIPGDGKTYCNIYGYDVCYIYGIYIPRVWWRSDAIRRIDKGETVDVVYGETVSEMNINSIHDWLKEYGHEYGWHRVFDAPEVQTEANRGKVCILTAKRKDTNRSGHISVILPEHGSHKAGLDSDGKVDYPLQSQAGSSNRQYFNSGSKWWESSNYSDFGYWVNEL